MKMKINQDLQKPLKTVFFGTSEFALPAIKYLVQNGYEISAVVTQPEKPVGRARVVMPSPVKKVAMESNIRIMEPHNLRTEEESFEVFKNINPSLCVVAAYGKIIPAKYLDLPEFGFINIHPSLLPKYRGPSPIQTAIMHGNHETGVSIMRLDAEVDHGGILGQKTYKLEHSTFYPKAEKELAELGAELLIEVLPKYISDEIKPEEQNHKEATFTKILSREDGRIDWNRTAEEIYNQIRALNPQPGTWTKWNDKVLNIQEAEPFMSPDNKTPGTIFYVDNKIAVATSKCYLILKQIQLEGGKKMDAKSFVNGHSDFVSSKLS
jgi:methionyl-tRNA formyltransferase